ncbi:MAG: DegV family protein [Oscillospiraceae bacterium]|nr:DegV family protein [Oscillospiraceae bacterium]
MIRLFADTASNLPVALNKKYSVNIIPLCYSMNGVDVQYDLERDFDGKAFYDAMRNGAEMKTSMINSATFHDEFEKVIKAGNEVVYIGLSGGVSGTVRAAEIAAEELREKYPEAKIAVIDSLGAGLGIGMQVVAMAKLIEEGRTFEEVVSITEERKNHMCQFFTVDDLSYLKKGGRISGATAAIGTILNIKPLLRGDEEGHIVAWGKCRGINKCILEIIKKYDELVFDKSADVMIIHGDNENAVDFLTEKLREHGFTGNTTVNYFEPVCGCHVGPGSVALFFWGERKL